MHTIPAGLCAWIQEASAKGAGKLFRWIKDEARGEVMEAEVAGHGPTVEPVTIMADLADEWGKLWHQEGYLEVEEERRVSRQMDDLRYVVRGLREAWGDS